MDCPYPQCARCKKAYDKLRARIAELEAENARYRSALEEIFKRFNLTPHPPVGNAIAQFIYNGCIDMANIASTALEVSQ